MTPLKQQKSFSFFQYSMGHGCIYDFYYIDGPVQD